jgi:hypothetical protein
MKVKYLEDIVQLYQQEVCLKEELRILNHSQYFLNKIMTLHLITQS